MKKRHRYSEQAHYKQGQALEPVACTLFLLDIFLKLFFNIVQRKASLYGRSWHLTGCDWALSNKVPTTLHAQSSLTPFSSRYLRAPGW